MELTRAQINTILHQRVDDQAIDVILAHDQAQRERIAQLEDWRANVTVALQREGGAHFADVPKHIRELVTQREADQQRLAEVEKERDELVKQKYSFEHALSEAQVSINFWMKAKDELEKECEYERIRLAACSDVLLQSEPLPNDNQYRSATYDDVWRMRRGLEKQLASAQANLAACQREKEDAVNGMREAHRISTTQQQATIQRLTEELGEVKDNYAKVVLAKTLVPTDYLELRQRLATLEGALKGFHDLFTENFDDPGMELFGLVDGKHPSPMNEALNKCVDDARTALQALAPAPGGHLVDANKMVWTTDEPQKPGRYRWRSPVFPDPALFHVVEETPGHFAVTNYSASGPPMDVRDLGGEWQGPLPTGAQPVTKDFRATEINKFDATDAQPGGEG